MIFTGRYQQAAQDVFINDLMDQQGPSIRCKTKARLDISQTPKIAWRAVYESINWPLLGLVLLMSSVHLALLVYAFN